MRALLDVNFLLALFDRGHTHYRRAHTWFGSNQAFGWASCPLTQNGLIRIVTRSTYPRPVTQADAIMGLRLQIGRSDHEFWHDDLSIVDAMIFDNSRILGPNQITDVYLLALAVKHGGRLVTFDRGIPLAAARGAEAKHLAVI